MKIKKTILAITLCLSFVGFANAQSTFLDILNAITSQKETLSDVTTKRFIVNSATNARFAGGKTREAVKISLPAGTKKWYYRVTVLKKESAYEYEPNETFYNLLSNGKKADLYSNAEDGLDIYLLGHSGDVDSFLETGNNDFRCFPKYTKTNVFTTVGTVDFVQENLWLGIKNPNGATGLKVIVEIVASGNFQ